MPRSTREPIEVRVESLSHEGRGLAHIDGKTTFIHGSLPGENVIFRYTRRHRRFDEGRVLEILQPSPRRIPPRCVHFEICGGCSLQHLSSDDQLTHKQEVLLEQLERIGGVQPESVLPPIVGPVWGYRRKARLTVKHVEKKGGALVGFREKHSPYVADISACDVLHPSVGKHLLELRALIDGLSIHDKIPQIEVAVDDRRCALVVRHLEPMTPQDHERLRAFAERHDCSIYLQRGGPETIEPLWPQPPPPLSYQTTTGGPTIYFEPTDFTQVNTDINRALIERVLSLLALERQDKVLELFCGLGNFTLPIAERVLRVTAIEGSAALVARAHANAKRNNIENVDFHTADLADAESPAPFLSGPYDKVLLDPPRTGAREVIDRMAFNDISRLVYVSCNPATLARDASLLTHKKGYRLAACGVVDMFPHTTHVESIALFQRDRR